MHNLCTLPAQEMNPFHFTYFQDSIILQEITLIYLFYKLQNKSTYREIQRLEKGEREKERGKGKKDRKKRKGRRKIMWLLWIIVGSTIINRKKNFDESNFK